MQSLGNRGCLSYSLPNNLHFFRVMKYILRPTMLSIFRLQGHHSLKDSPHLGISLDSAL